MVALAENSKVKPQRTGKILQLGSWAEKSKDLLENDLKLFLLKIKITSVKTESSVWIKLLSVFHHST